MIVQNILKHFWRLLVLSLACGGASAQQFLSLHQFPVTYRISSALDASGSLYYTWTPQLFGFKDQFAPTGVSGCVMGYPELRTLCDRPANGFSLTLPGYSSYAQYKVYIPAGTKYFVLAGYLPQSVQYAVASKFDSPPVRTTALSPEEYQTAKLGQHIEKDFARLLNGEERLIVHDGGGSITLSGIARLDAKPLETGRWLYVRVLNGSSIDSLTAAYEVDRDLYRAAYNTIQFGADGDPVSGGTVPTDPTDPTDPTEPSGYTLQVGSANTLTLEYGMCELRGTAETYLNLTKTADNAWEVSLKPEAANLTADSPKSIQCDGSIKTITIKINDGGSVGNAVVENPQVSADGVLSLKLTRQDGEFIGSTVVWVGARIPVPDGVFSQDDDYWFFLTPDGWQAQILQNATAASVAYGSSPTQKDKTFSIPLGITTQFLRDYNVKIYFGYQDEGGSFQNKGVVWSK